LTQAGPRTGRTRPFGARLAGALLAFALLAACGSGGGGDEADTSGARAYAGESGLDDAGVPVRGGRLVYGLEAESADGWCLPEAQLAISGLMVEWAIYDPLVIMNDKAQVVPFLAKTVEHSEDYRTWTLTIRDGVTFHDNTALDADVVKQNLDAFRGADPGRPAVLTSFVLKNIASVTVTGPMTVQIGTTVPWVALPATLTQVGIMAESQINDKKTCNSKMVGTGPFKLASWKPNQSLVAQRNPDYWLIAPDGQPYPYADAIEFRPISETQQRVNALESGEIDVMLTPQANVIAGPLTDLRNLGDINLLVSEEHAEVNFVMLNSSRAPFDNPDMRRAVAMGLDRDELNELANAGFPTVADQPFPPGDDGYVDDPGFPEHDPEAARALVDKYVDGGGKAELTLTVQADPTLLARGEIIQNQLSKVGIAVKIQSVDQTTLVSDAISGAFQAMTFRRHPGGEPDLQYIWWYGVDNPVNFARIDDPEIDRLLDEGRSNPDPAQRTQRYEEVSRRFGSQVWNVWLNYTPWAVAMAQDVHGVLNVDLPDGGGKPFTGLAAGHPLAGMWRDSG
jgi:peptide/nickel transport system substrate-binding protein